MPEDVRRNYEQAMKGFAAVSETSVSGSLADMKNIFADNNDNGVPDIMEGNPVINVAGGVKYIADGKVFNTLDELPPEIRAKYNQAMGSLDKNANGVPDFLEGMSGSNPSQIATPSSGVRNTTLSLPARSRPPAMTSQTIEPESSGGWMMALMGVLLAGMCLAAAAAGVWYFYIR
jgi:hypothetical protein